MRYIRKYKKMAEQLQKDCDGYTIEKFIQQENDVVEFAKNEGTTDIEAVFGLVIEGFCDKCKGRIARCCD